MGGRGIFGKRKGNVDEGGVLKQEKKTHGMRALGYAKKGREMLGVTVEFIIILSVEVGISV